MKRKAFTTFSLAMALTVLGVMPVQMAHAAEGASQIDICAQNDAGGSLAVDTQWTYDTLRGTVVTTGSLEGVPAGSEVTLTAPSTHTENYTFYEFAGWETARLVDEVVVPSDGASVESNISLDQGAIYILEASGVYTFIEDNEWRTVGADADWANWYDWVKSPFFGYADFPEYHLSLMVDDGPVDWGEYNPSHVYSHRYIGKGDLASFTISDNYYPDNSGSLSVKIWRVDETQTGTSLTLNAGITDMRATAQYTTVIRIDKHLIPLEVVNVPSDGETVSSSVDLQDGVDYVLEADGIYFFEKERAVAADAEWADWSGWTRNLGYPGECTESHLDLLVDGVGRDWGDYNESHKYFLKYTGTGTSVSFRISDNYYDDNFGSLTVRIWRFDPRAVPVDTQATFSMEMVVRAYSSDITDAYVEDGMAAELVLDSLETTSGDAESFFPGNGRGKNGMSATKIEWMIGELTSGTDYVLDITAYTGTNPQGKQFYGDLGDHTLNDGPVARFTYNGVQYELHGPSIFINAVE